MKRRTVILSITVLLLMSIARLILNAQNESEDEIQSYIRSLHYNFSARVDSIIFLNKNRGRCFLVCRLTAGQFNNGVEDSLNQQLKSHEWMRFLFVDSKGQAQIFQDDGFKYKLGDSVYVNSDTDQFEIYRNEKDILKSSVSETIKHKASWEFLLRKKLPWHN